MINEPLAQIRVLVVDDSAFMRAALSRMIALDPDLRVVGTAASGAEAMQVIPHLDPDVITLDVEMPGLDGMETLRRIMALFPRPVIMVSSVTLKNAETTFNALAAGAFDYVPKQLSSTSLDIHHIQGDLVAKIKGAAASRHSWDGNVPRKLPRTEPRARATLPPTAAIVALGISTGGPKALEEILPLLPADFPVPMLIVQHMPVGFTAPFAERLNKLCEVTVCEASHGEFIRPGVVYLAAAGSQMTVDRPTGSRTDIMMQSVASAFHSEAMGVIMTGMGSDGAQGMNAIHREGGFTVGQDQHSCAVYGMPRVCAEMGILDKVVSLAQIPHEILQAAHYRKTRAG